MPEIRFKIQWPDGSQEICYSPSLIVKEYFEPGRDYDLLDFVARSQTALNIASDRVLAKYGRACGLPSVNWPRSSQKRCDLVPSHNRSSKCWNLLNE